MGIDSSRQIKWMERAIELARLGQSNGEVPVGSVVVYQDEIIGQGYNNPIIKNDPTCHAEINAIRHACLYKNNYRLPGATIYITLEPCIMCLGAIVQARIQEVVFGAFDTNRENNIKALDKLNYENISTCQYRGGVLSEQCSELLSTFFITVSFVRCLLNPSFFT